MPTTRSIIIFLTILGMFSSATAQTAEFTWSDPVCEYRGTYDRSKISEAQIKDTYELINFGMGLPLQNDHTVFSKDGIPRLDVGALDKEYRETVQKLTALRLADSAYFLALRHRHRRALNQYYNYARISLLSYSDPKAMKEQCREEKCHIKYGDAVAHGGQELLRTWQRLNEEMRESNASPASVRARFESEMASPERYTYALIEVITFGWWNCVNESIQYVPNDGTQEEEFKKLFANVTTVSCDEP